ncbi:MAG: transcription-repair coupling factor [Planctomycetota bacterium]
MAGITPQAQSAIQLQELPNLIASDQDFLDCVDGLKHNAIATFDSVFGSSCALLATALLKSFDHLLVICPDDKSADNVTDDISTFTSATLAKFPAFVPAGDSRPTVDYEFGDRMRLVKNCLRDKPPEIIITTPGALLQGAVAKDDIEQHSRLFSIGQQIELSDLKTWLLEHGFQHTTAVELPGEFSVRGGIIDLFAPDWSAPVRIELFDDEIESIRYFHVNTQRSDQEIDQVELTLLSAEFPASDHLANFLPGDTLVLTLEPEESSQRANTFINQYPHPKKLHSWDAARKSLAKFPTATASRLSTGELGNTAKMPVESIEKFSGDFSEIRTELDRIGEGCDLHIVVRTSGEIARIKEILKTSKAAATERLHISEGIIHEGFKVRGHGVIVIGADQLFHRTDLRRAGRRKLSKAIDSFLDLREGDLVVHLSHGIARFRGLKMLDKDGQHTEHLELEFHGHTRIYVPASKIDLVQKYIGGTKTQPVLARIGGKSWIRQKEIAEQAVTDLAAEMIELQASRNSQNGIVYKPDTTWQTEFEQSFPYHETADQLTAIESIKDDMQSPRPMDRLLCGDVGFGKTEVAMRAAFKAVENGYQVAVLVPTTILAEQHMRSFTQRMIEFPLEIAKLSRFCTTKEIKESLAKLKSGQADIGIGTHRIVSKDVDFYNLGLVIIDEEQRFGVAHKERLKSLRNTVDVLTLSATPIPRTLHMSLVGVRDISNLETPPEDRVPVETKVTRFDEELIRSAVLRELNRGGQIYFVHNRVNDIHVVKQRLQEIVPEASIIVGHGQMQEDELEKVMTDFIAGRYDILLATTIIESGLDIPNANTMFIDNADNFGLSDLHQLRGRVGRYKNRAYCYLLLEPRKHLTPIAAKRLQAIETFSDMGAGFAISMRDLEIRGAGNLLGTEQSGHIAAIGYELYCQLLENAVRQLKKEPPRMRIEVDIDLPLSAYFPDDYIKDRRQKIDIYRRLTRLERFDQIAEFKSELVDRFGPLTPEGKRLLKLCELKLEATVWQIRAIFIEDKFLGIRFSNRDRFEQLVNKRKGIVRIVDEETAYVTLKSTAIPPNKMLALVKSILQP